MAWFENALKNRVFQVKEMVRPKLERDSLTGLLLKSSLIMMENRILKNHGADFSTFAAITVDIDLFKELNDESTSDTGNTILCEVARRIRIAVRQEDIVARSGGDEFLIILPGISSELVALNIADRVFTEVGLPITDNGLQLYVSTTMGIAFSDDESNGIVPVINNAEMALQQAKQFCRGTIHFFDRHMAWDVGRRRKMAEELRQAINRDELYLHYQPIVDLKKSTVPRLEALVRWQHPELGTVPPGDFIPVAEASGLIQSIGLWVLRRAFEDLKVLDEMGLTEVGIAVNLSPQQLKFVSTVNMFIEIAKAYPEHTHRVAIEVTEDTVIDERYQMSKKLYELRNAGYAIMLDDFGAGNASIGRLRQFHFDQLKIDRSLIANIDNSEADREMVRAILLIANSINVSALAEGVESASIVEILQEEGCRYVQGFYFSKPLPLENAAKFIQEREETSGLATLLESI